MRSIVALAASLLLAVPAGAADRHFYVGVGGSALHIETFNFVQDSGFAASTGPNTLARTAQFSEDTTGWQLFAGYMFTRNFGVLVKYSDFGDTTDSFEGSLRTTDPNNPQAPPVIEEFSFDATASLDGYGIYLVQVLPLTDNFEFSLQAGWTDQTLDLEWTSPQFSGARSIDDTGFAGAALLRYRFLEKFALSAEVEYLAADFRGVLREQIRYGLNAEYHFR